MPSATRPSRLAESWGTHCPTRLSTVERSDATWAASAAAAEPPVDPEPVDPEPVEREPVESLSEDAAAGTGTPTVTVGTTTGVGAGVPKTAAGRAARTPTATSTTATTTETPATIHGTVERAGAGATPGQEAGPGGGTGW